MKRRSTWTTTVLVLTFLSLTTTPCSTRFGIFVLSYVFALARLAGFFAGFAAAAAFFLAGAFAVFSAGLVRGWAFAGAVPICPSTVMMRAMSRRTTRNRAVFSNCPLA